jgi:hypothetical protein
MGQDIAGAHSPGVSTRKYQPAMPCSATWRRHALDAAARVDLPAGRARLGDLQAGPAQRENVADAGLFFGDAARREVLAQPAGMEVARLGKGAPPARRSVRAETDARPSRAAVGARVGMLVTGQPVAADRAGPASAPWRWRCRGFRPGSRPTRPVKDAADNDWCDQFHSQAAPRTPEESPWRCFSNRVATWSENTCAPQARHVLVKPVDVGQAAAQHDDIRIEDVDDPAPARAPGGLRSVAGWHSQLASPAAARRAISVA